MTHIIVCDAPTPDIRRRRFDIAKRVTLEELVEAEFPKLTDEARARLRVTITAGGKTWAVPSALWRFTTPQPGAVVALRMVPGGYALGVQVLNLALQAGVGLNTAFTIAKITSLAAGVIGTAALSAAAASFFVPQLPEREAQRSGEQLNQLDGWQNTVNPNGAFSFPLGITRMSPLIVGRPYATVIGGQQYLTGLFAWGHGRLQIDDIRIGETPIANYTGVEVETTEGTGSDTPITLYQEQNLQDSMRIELDAVTVPGEYTYHVWTTPRATDRVRLIFSWPNGLFRVGGDGRTKGAEVGITIWQREDEEDPWVEVTYMLTPARTRDGFFREYEWSLPQRGAWQIRVARVTGAGDDQSDATYWFSACGIREQAPLDVDFPLALTAVRMPATQIANGTLDALNGIASRYARVYDSGTDTWSDAISGNAAAGAVTVLESSAGAYPAPADQMHLDEWGEFFDFCAAKGLSFNGVLAGDQDLGTVLSAICAAGRATWRRDGEGWGVVIDRPQDVVVDTISPRNARNIRWSRNYVDAPDAFTVRFRDETAGYEQSERSIPWPGFVGDPDLTEEVTMEGVTNPDQVWIEGRRRQYEVIYRTDVFTAIQDGEVRHATRGDAVNMSCTLLADAHASGRVIAVVGNVVHFDGVAVMEAGETYAIQWQDFDEADTVGDAITAPVGTMVGEHSGLVVLGDDLPPVGRVIHFGPASEVAIRCRITRIEPAEDGAFHLTMVNDAPEVDALTDAEVAPPWDRVAGDDISLSGTPDAPIIGTISAEHPEFTYTDSGALLVRVPVQMPSDNPVPVTRIDVSHRIAGAGAYSVVSVSGSTGIADIAETYQDGDSVEIFATAYSVFGDEGTDSATETFAVTGALPLPTQIDPDSLSVMGGLGYAQLTFATRADTGKVQIFRVADGDTLDVDTDAIGVPIAVSGSSTVMTVDGDATRSNLLASSDMTGWTEAGGWSITSGVATHTPGSASTLTQSLSLTAGDSYRGSITVSGRTAGSVVVQLAGTTDVPTAAIDADGIAYFDLAAVTGNDRIEIVATSDFDGDVTAALAFRESATSAPQGIFDYYVAPITADNIGRAPVGPVTATIV
jgi:hypothetical protein